MGETYILECRSIFWARTLTRSDMRGAKSLWTPSTAQSTSRGDYSVKIYGPARVRMFRLPAGTLYFITSCAWGRAVLNEWNNFVDLLLHCLLLYCFLSLFSWSPQKLEFRVRSISYSEIQSRWGLNCLGFWYNSQAEVYFRDTLWELFFSNDNLQWTFVSCYWCSDVMSSRSDKSV